MTTIDDIRRMNDIRLLRRNLRQFARSVVEQVKLFDALLSALEPEERPAESVEPEDFREFEK